MRPLGTLALLENSGDASLRSRSYEKHLKSSNTYQILGFKVLNQILFGCRRKKERQPRIIQALISVNQIIGIQSIPSILSDVLLVASLASETQSKLHDHADFSPHPK